MTSPLFTSTCAAYRLQLSRLRIGQWKPNHTQIRGKKKNAKARTTISVRLLDDLESYGRKGSIVPVPIGQMRNYLYPQRIAEYVTIAQTQELKKSGFVPQRDIGFGRRTSDEGTQIKDVKTTMLKQAARGTRRATLVKVDLNLLPPRQTFEVLSRILPPVLHFYRAPIAQDEYVEAVETPQPTTSTEVAGPSQSLYPDRTSSIYGSVTVGDVVTSIKALVAASDEGAGRIAIGEDDVRFVGNTEEQMKVKRLGGFEVEIKMKGNSESLKRQVRVLAEEDAPGDIAEGDQAVEELAGEQPITEDVSNAFSSLAANVGVKLEEVESLLEETSSAISEQKMNDVEQQRKSTDVERLVASVATKPNQSAIGGVGSVGQGNQRHKKRA